MTVRLNPYLNFKGQTREAMEFYQSIFGGELTLSTYADFGMEVDPSEANLIMHAQFESPDGITLMGSDPTSQWNFDYDARTRYSCSLSGDDTEKLTSWWERLSEGAQIEMPLAQAPWGDSFGSLTDRFGIAWLINVQGGRQQ